MSSTPSFPYSPAPIDPPIFHHPAIQSDRSSPASTSKLSPAGGDLPSSSSASTPPGVADGVSGQIPRVEVQDLWATLLFLAFLGCFMALASVGVPRAIAVDFDQSYHLARNSDSSRRNGIVGMAQKDVKLVIGLAISLSASVSAAWFALIIIYPGPMMHMSYFLSAGLMTLSSSYFAYFRAWTAAAVWFFAGVFFLLVYWWIRRKIPLAIVLLKVVCKVLVELRGTIVAAFVGISFVAVFWAVWFLAVLGANQWATERGASAGLRVCVGIVCLFFLYWTNEISRNTVHVTVSGAFAMYYFASYHDPATNTIELPVSHVTGKSALRAFTTSFGSVCFGSLLVSLVQTVQSAADLLRGDRRNRNDRGGNHLSTCLFSGVDDLVMFFNKYAFSKLAIHGCSYCDAAQSTHHLLASYGGLDLLSRDAPVISIICASSLATGMLCCFATFAYLELSPTVAKDAGLVAVVCACAGLLGLWMLLVLIEAILAGNAVTIVCLAEDPYMLQRLQPDLFERILDMWPGLIFGGDSPQDFSPGSGFS